MVVEREVERKTTTGHPIHDIALDTPPPSTPFIQMLIDGTNKFAEKTIAEKERAGKLTPGSRWKKWSAVTMDSCGHSLAHAC